MRTSLLAPMLPAIPVAIAILASPATSDERAHPASEPAVIRVGLVGLDTSHAPAFTAILNDPKHPDHVRGALVVAGFKGGSPDMKRSSERIEIFTEELRKKWQVKLYGTIEE